MEFKIRGNKVDVFRSVASAESDQEQLECVGVLKADTLRVKEDLRSNCTEGELAEIQAWIEAQRAKAALKGEHAAVTLAEQMSLAGNWLARAEAASSAPLRAEIREAWRGLRQTLNVAKTRGNGKNKKQKRRSAL